MREFSTAVGSHTMYSEGHPALGLVAERLLRLLEIPLREAKSLTITVQRECLVVGPAATEPSDLLLSGFASRLHLHQLQSLTLLRGIQPDELSSLLAALSKKVGYGAEPLGLAPDEDLSRWPHVGVQRSDLLGAGTDEQGKGARTSPDSDPSFTVLAGKNLVETELQRIALSIEAQLGDEHLERSIAVQIFALARNLADARGERAQTLVRRVSELVLMLEADTLTHLLNLGADGNRTNQFLRDCSQWMEPEAVIELVRTAAEIRQDPMVPRVLRLTLKLAAQTSPYDRHRGSGARLAIRAIVQGLIDEWGQEDRRPEDYQEQASAVGVRTVPPDGTVKMCIELDVANERAHRASLRLVSGGEAATLLDLLEKGPEESNAIPQLWRGISTPRALHHLLQAEEPDLEALDRITEHVGLEGVESMLEVLAGSERRSARQYLLDQISGMGPQVGPQVAGLLHDHRWYVVRNMLRLLRSLSYWPDNLDVAPYLHHEDARVRVEAVRLAAGWPDHRETALVVALQDEDDEVVTVGLREAYKSCPPAAEPVLIQHLKRRILPEKLRVLAIRALGRRESRGALKAIVGACVRRRWVSKAQLSSEASLLRAGVRELALRWPNESAARRVIGLAATVQPATNRPPEDAA